MGKDTHIWNTGSDKRSLGGGREKAGTGLLSKDEGDTTRLGKKEGEGRSLPQYQLEGRTRREGYMVGEKRGRRRRGGGIWQGDVRIHRRPLITIGALEDKRRGKSAQRRKTRF